MNSKLDIITNVKLELFSSDGKLKETRKVHNTVTDAGHYGIIDQILASPTLSKVGWMEVGTGTGGTTKLNSYLTGRVALTSKTRLNKVVTMVATFPGGVSTGTITEAGVFDVATENAVNMWMYATFTAIPKGASDSLTITWTLTIS